MVRTTIAPRHPRISPSVRSSIRPRTRYSDEDTTIHGEHFDHDDSFFHWEEESTLFSDLLEDVPEELTSSKVTALAESLQASFDYNGKVLKKEIASTFVPIVNRVKELYRVVDDQVDDPFARGVLSFNDACKETELMALKDQDQLTHAYDTTQANIQRLFAQLKVAYDHRDQLWIDFEKALDGIVEPTQGILNNTLTRTERTIANLEKHCKLLDKDDGESASTARERLKGLFSKLG